MKMSDLNVASRAEKFQKAFNDEYGSVRGQGLGDVEKEWRSFRDALLKCVKNVRGVSRVGGCMRKGCKW